MFTFSPLLGAQSEATASQSLLELDGGVKVLIDVGWDESFDTERLEELIKHVPTISLILLTHATISHIGAYAHCCKNIAQFTRIPVYATRPVIDLGRTLIQDLYASTPRAATTIAQNEYGGDNFLRQAPTSEEIARYFQMIRDLKYMQAETPRTAPNSPPLNGLTITAYNSGRTLGGTIWHIQHGLESIVYGVDWGQYKENVYAGAAWIETVRGGGSDVIEQLRKPTALICSSRSPNVLRPDARDEQLLTMIENCVARGGTVLIPVDSSARVLEIAYLLEHAWRKDATSDKPNLSTAKLYLAGRTVGSLHYQARTLIEWMKDGISQELENLADNSKRVNGNADGSKGRDVGPLDFKYLRLLERKAQIDRMLSQEADMQSNIGKVIVASDTSLEWGFSRDVFRSIADDPRNLVVLTEIPGTLPNDQTSLARTMWSWWNEKSDNTLGDPVEGGGRSVELLDAKKQALEGVDLDIYQRWLATQRQMQATTLTGGIASQPFADGADDISSESESESEGSDNEQQGKALNISTTIAQASRKKVVLKDEDLGANILIKKKGHYDFDVRGKKGRDRMFPTAVKKRRNDEFGDLIRPEDYLREEEREDENSAEAKHNMSKADLQAGLGKKRKWDDIGTNTKNAAGGGGGGANKRPQPGGRMAAASADDMPASGSPDGPLVDDLDTIEDKEEEAPIVGPARLVVTKASIAVKLRIAFVDFSGLHTERNLEMLLPLVQPRKLILVGGSPAETAAVSTKYKDIVSKSRAVSADIVDVFTPAVGASIDASVDTNAWVVKLAEPLVQRLRWQSLRGLGIVTITGQLLATAKLLENGSGGGLPHRDRAAEDDEEAPNKRVKVKEEREREEEEDGEEQNDEGRDGGSAELTKEVVVAENGGGGAAAAAAAVVAAVAAVPTLDVLPMAMSSATRSTAQPLHVGELRLADLRRSMQSSGHTAEFRGEGTLVIDGSVAVKKTTAGRVELESIGLGTDGGPAMQMGGTFYAVRKMIYDGLAVVAGG